MSSLCQRDHPAEPSDRGIRAPAPAHRRFPSLRLILQTPQPQWPASDGGRLPPRVSRRCPRCTKSCCRRRRHRRARCRYHCKQSAPCQHRLHKLRPPTGRKMWACRTSPPCRSALARHRRGLACRRTRPAPSRPSSRRSRCRRHDPAPAILLGLSRADARAPLPAFRPCR